MDNPRLYPLQVIISCLLAAVLAAPPQVKYGPNEVIPILSQVNIVNEDGSFQNSYESGDGSRAESSGSLKNIGPQEDGQVAQGSYSFYTPDGQLIEVRYIADENGFQPQSNALPVGPPIPEEILKALAYNAAHPEEDNLRNYESGDGSRAESSGSLKNIGPQEDGQVAQGSYSFYTPDGQLIEVRYIADENGFQPQSNALPVGPPIPEEILKALAYNAAHPEEDNLRK
ncbi:unnamed protein product [Timema podura]|uniref:Uncharacterized protein n=1 Tax=Timema podura TaxID=61482 RepID=A0ABN7NMJ9_TIMPD|nr:unnamed protein product [Timema podura]